MHKIAIMMGGCNDHPSFLYKYLMKGREVMSLINVIDTLKRAPTLYSDDKDTMVVLTESSVEQIINEIRAAIDNNTVGQIEPIVVDEVVAVTHDPDNIDDDYIIECNIRTSSGIRPLNIKLPDGCKNTYLLVDAIRE